MDHLQTLCVLDREHRILYVGGDWDAFANANDAPQATGPHVAGQSIFDAIRGFETRAFLNAALFAVRDSGQQFVMDYRCDSPGIRRFMRMTISPLKSDRTLVVHDFVGEERIGRDPVVWMFAPDATAQKCSICCAVRYGSVWMDPFLAPGAHPAHVTYAMCPDCRAHAAALLNPVPPEGAGATVIRFPRE